MNSDFSRIALNLTIFPSTIPWSPVQEKVELSFLVSSLIMPETMKKSFRLIALPALLYFEPLLVYKTSNELDRSAQILLFYLLKRTVVFRLVTTTSAWLGTFST